MDYKKLKSYKTLHKNIKSLIGGVDKAIELTNSFYGDSDSEVIALEKQKTDYILTIINLFNDKFFYSLDELDDYLTSNPNKFFETYIIKAFSYSISEVVAFVKSEIYDSGVDYGQIYYETLDMVIYGLYMILFNYGNDLKMDLLEGEFYSESKFLSRKDDIVDFGKLLDLYKNSNLN
jgi:hypothetical protein